jgi:hypothetical protein
MSDLQTFRWALDLLLLGFATVLWFLLRKLISDVGAITKALADYKLHVAENYVTQSSLSKSMDALAGSIGEVFRKLERIEDKLDGKADK